PGSGSGAISSGTRARGAEGGGTRSSVTISSGAVISGSLSRVTTLLRSAGAALRLFLGPLGLLECREQQAHTLGIVSEAAGRPDRAVARACPDWAWRK